MLAALRMLDRLQDTAHLCLANDLLAKAEGDKMTPPAKFAAVTAGAMFGHQRSG
jgi:hypothetical protein